MVKHIVLFKLKESLCPAEKMEIMTRFKEAIEALLDTIDCIRAIEVGININQAELWDMALVSDFDSMEDLKKYAVHPAHVAAAALIKDAKIDRACVDYEY